MVKKEGVLIVKSPMLISNKAKEKQNRKNGERRNGIGVTKKLYNDRNKHENEWKDENPMGLIRD